MYMQTHKQKENKDDKSNHPPYIVSFESLCMHTKFGDTISGHLTVIQLTYYENH